MCVFAYVVKHSLIKEPLFLLTSLMSHSHTDSVILPRTLWLPHVTGTLMPSGKAEIESSYCKVDREREIKIKWLSVNLFEKSFLLIK